MQNGEIPGDQPGADAGAGGDGGGSGTSTDSDGSMPGLGDTGTDNNNGPDAGAGPDDVAILRDFLIRTYGFHRIYHFSLG